MVSIRSTAPLAWRMLVVTTTSSSSCSLNSSSSRAHFATVVKKPPVPPAAPAAAAAAPTKAASSTKEQDDEGEDSPRYSPAELRAAEMKQVDSHMIFGDTTEFPEPILPDNPSEVSALDPAEGRHSVLPDGRKRMVHIRQGHSSSWQSPTNKENYWVISFQDDGEVGDAWINPLMGWVSGADPMATTMHSQVQFRTAKEAVYFCQKRGWSYLIDQPIFRTSRTDDAQYQDNFLPQRIAALVQRERTQTKQWERSQACTSHYMRPLTYHGDGLVPQHGLNPNEPIAKHVPGIYKMR